MEKVFAGPGNRAGAADQRSEKFNVAQLIGDTEAKDRDAQRGSKDYDSDCKYFYLFTSSVIRYFFAIFFWSYVTVWQFSCFNGIFMRNFL